MNTTSPADDQSPENMNPTSNSSSEIMNSDISLNFDPSLIQKWFDQNVPMPEQNLNQTGKIRIQAPQGDRLISDFAQDLADVLKDKGLYNRGGKCYIVADGKLHLISAEMFRTWIEHHVIPFRETASRNGVTQTDHTISLSDSYAILSSTQFLNKLRPMKYLNPVRMPVFRQNGSIALLPHGYDHESLTLTLTSDIGYDEEMNITEAKRVIEDLLGEFCFAKDNGRSMSVSIASMLTLFGRDLIPSGCVVPGFINTANAPGAGKTMLVFCAIVPVYGVPDIESIPEKDSELQKVLLAGVISGSNYLFFDNAKGHLNYPSLEAFLTSSKYGGRILGVSEKVFVEHKSLAFITGNDVSLSSDLNRRTLMAELFMENERSGDRVFKQPMDVERLLQNRSVILSALWSLIRSWDGAGRPMPSKRNSDFMAWSEIIGGIVEHAGWCSPLIPADVDDAGDTEQADMRKLVTMMTSKVGFRDGLKFSKMEHLCRESGAFSRLVPPTDDDDDSDNGMPGRNKAILSKIFRRYKNRILCGKWKFLINGVGHTRTYSLAPSGE